MDVEGKKMEGAISQERRAQVIEYGKEAQNEPLYLY